MKLIHDSINIAETDNIETLKNQVKACIFIKLQEKDMNGFFGDMCRYASIIGQGGRFHTFNREFNGEQDWEIMKACLINAGDLETIVNYKYAVWRENEGWRCVSGRESGIEYLWEFFAPEIRALMDYGLGSDPCKSRRIEKCEIVHKNNKRKFTVRRNGGKLTIRKQRKVASKNTNIEDHKNVLF